MEKLEPLCVAGNECRMMRLLWKTEWQSVKKLDTEVPYDPAISLVDRDPKESKVVTQWIFVRPYPQKRYSQLPKGRSKPSIYGEMMDKEKVHTHAVHTPTLRPSTKKDILPHATTRMNPEDNALSATSWSQKNKYFPG